ncbi:peptide chain release factor N(5)-glutamine methyltransferase [uncultured Nitrosomonas sp.]|uniref:peptide chain release factor N(5)-glutamine methyltransferase n=1 Tax=uncultured Nitrosomonas sp. TaxID=156424 RepID=UPI0025CD90E8|nr:peptide chain release factor N(5)-glutamine methyltransferase [uncultured Nitrosomonas sp.]
MQPVTISHALAAAYSTINKIDAILLLQHVLIVNHAFLLTYPDQILTAQQVEKFSSLVQQRIKGLPIAYLIGERAFFDLTLKITEAVLIPRPETELLVEWALKLIPSDKFFNVLDLGTGSGAIAISIAKHRPQTQIVAVDLSPAAVDVCRRNADILKVANLHAISGNWFDELSGEKFDLIVSNPPYVAENDPHLLQGDLRFEPRIALSTGEHGMACITHIINAAPSYLNKEGWLLLEHGYDQAEACRKLLRDMDFSNICSYPDLAGIMRVSGGQLNLSI